MPFPAIQYEPLILVLPILNAFVLHWADITVFWVTFGLTFLVVGIYVVRIIDQLTTYLGIRCFKIVPKLQPPPVAAAKKE